MATIPASLVDRDGESYGVTFTPPTATNPVARIDVIANDGFPVAEVMFGERSPGYFYIDDVQVHRGRRKGLGSQLLAIAEDYAAEKGFSEVHGVIVAYDPSSADCAILRAWYERHGYTVRFVAGHPRKEYCGDITKKLTSR